MPDLQIRGLAALNRVLKSLPKDLADKELQKAVTASAKVFIEPAKNNAPKDSGDMAEQIKSRLVNTENRYRKATSVRPRKGGGKDPFYWIFVELGTEKQPHQSFLRTSFDAHSPEAAEVFRTALAKGLRKYAK